MVDVLGYAWISFGMLGQFADPPAGLQRLTLRCRGIGIDTRHSPYQWFDVNQIAADIVTLKNSIPTAKIIAGGASLGDNEAVEIANILNAKKINIDLLFGFQRSKFGRQFLVPSNVVEAVEIHDPNFLEDIFGDDPWVLAPGNKRTKLYNVPIKGYMHPGDFAVPQDIVFRYVEATVGHVVG
jgi:hypothetical protein